jgi:hypothetical protein
MSDLVRVRVSNSVGTAEVSVGREHAESVGLEILDEPAVNGDGTVRVETRADGRPVKPRVSVASAAAKRTERGAPATSDAEEATA